MSKKSRPPKLRFAPIQPLQDYYDDGEGNYYSVARLIDDAKSLPVFDCPLAAINLTTQPWDGSDMYYLAWHVRKVIDADLSVPILLDWRGRIVDGRHRVIKAIAQGKRTIPAQRMTWKPEPDRTEGKD